MAHVVEHVGGRHLPPVQILEPQSAADPQGWPSATSGAVVAGAHRPFLQLAEAQSEGASVLSQSLPSPHAGAQAGGWQVNGVPLQTPEAQSEPAVQACPKPQLGEQFSGFGLGGWHLPVLQVPEAQSEPLSQSLPGAHVPLHPGLAHLPAVQTPE